MNELTKQLQEIMVPKAALIAYEYQESHYASGSHYWNYALSTKREEWKPAFRLHMNSWTPWWNPIRTGTGVSRTWLPPNMLWCDTRRGHESYVWYNPPGKRRMFFKNDLNIGDGMFHVPGVIISLKMKGWTSSPTRGKNRTGGHRSIWPLFST